MLLEKWETNEELLLHRINQNSQYLEKLKIYLIFSNIPKLQGS